MSNKQRWLVNAGLGLRLFSTKSSDLLLAFFIVSVIALMILPLPLLLIDTLVAANIALGTMLIMMSIYVNSPLQFSVFPSVLLISTLFRLALSVSTTRMILLEGDAGNIIDTFGNLVAGGNIVVGLVVFLIITLVQFLVIAKGSERVAEVGARFTLDAMPGKQLSIDSDLRSGLIDKTEARKKRADLETESQLHGSLDGAMKFVKGDAIAGIVIIIINLLGGLAVGVFQLGMDAGAAIQKYSILTIGDGLVAQIPALFGAMAAGLIVTRVSKAGSTEHLGESIQQQFAAIPRVILVAGGLCLMFAAIPGFPTGVFLVMGLVMLTTGAMLFPNVKSMVNKVSAPALDKVMQRDEETIVRSQVSHTAVITGEESSALVLNFPASGARNGNDTAMKACLENLLAQHFRASGIRLPTVLFRWHHDDQSQWWLDVYDVPVCSGEFGGESSELDDICQQCMIAIRRNIKLFVGIEETSKLLQRCSDTSPEIVREVQRALPLQGIAVIVRNLAEEEVPLKNLQVALEAIVEASQSEKDLVNLTEYARIALGRQICNVYAKNGVISAVGLSFELEEMLLKDLRSNASGHELSASPELLIAIVNNLEQQLKSKEDSVVIVPVALRRHIRSLLAEKLFDTAVISYAEVIKPFELNIFERVAANTDNVVAMGTNRNSAA